MKVVLSLGGSIIVPAQIDVTFLQGFRRLILDFVSQGNQAVIIAGGGHICRLYQDAARQLLPTVRPVDLDWIGIKATKLNAELIRACFGEHAYPEVIDDPTKPLHTSCPIIVGSGWQPGCSSDKDAILLAINLQMDTVVNLTNIAYVYDRDPAQYPDARPLQHLSWEQMQAIVGRDFQPGMNVPFGPMAADLAARHGVRVVIMKGTDLENLRAFLSGQPYQGTTITS